MSFITTHKVRQANYKKTKESILSAATLEAKNLLDEKLGYTTSWNSDIAIGVKPGDMTKAFEILKGFEHDGRVYNGEYHSELTEEGEDFSDDVVEIYVRLDADLTEGKAALVKLLKEKNLINDILFTMVSVNNEESEFEVQEKIREEVLGFQYKGFLFDVEFDRFDLGILVTIEELYYN